MIGNKWAGGLLLLLSLPAFAQTPTRSAPPGVELRYQSLSGPISHPHLAGVHFLYGGELSLDADVADGDRTLGRYVLRGDVQAHEADTTLRAQEITFDGPARQAQAANVLLTQRAVTIRSGRLEGTPQLLTITDADVTTAPPDERPDYHLHAQTITLDALHRQGTFRNVTLYLFHTRLLTIPRFSFRLGSKKKTGQHQIVAPVVSVSSRYGAFVSVGSSLHVGSAPIHYRLLLPTRMGLEADVRTVQTLISTRPSAVPPVVFPLGAAGMLARFRLLATAPRPPLPEGDPLLFRDFLPEANPISLFDVPERGSLTLGEEVSIHMSAQGNKRDDLYVSRLPEVMLTGQVPLTPVPAPPVYGDPDAFRRSLRHIVLYADAQEAVGSYREQLSDAPYSVRERRVRTQVGLSARPLLIGQNTVLLPSISITTNSYSGSDTAYRYDQLSLAVTHYFSTVSAVGVQYLASTTGGDSPFNFDVLDTSRELDLRVQGGNRRFVTAGRIRYDLSHSGVIDYQLAIAPALHGFSPVFSYNFRTRSLGLGVEVKGITF